MPFTRQTLCHPAPPPPPVFGAFPMDGVSPIPSTCLITTSSLLFLLPRLHPCNFSSSSPCTSPASPDDLLQPRLSFCLLHVYSFFFSSPAACSPATRNRTAAPGPSCPWIGVLLLYPRQTPALPRSLLSLVPSFTAVALALLHLRPLHPCDLPLYSDVQGLLRCFIQSSSLASPLLLTSSVVLPTQPFRSPRLAPFSSLLGAPVPPRFSLSQCALGAGRHLLLFPSAPRHPLLLVFLLHPLCMPRTLALRGRAGRPAESHPSHSFLLGIHPFDRSLLPVLKNLASLSRQGVQPAGRA